MSPNVAAVLVARQMGSTGLNVTTAGFGAWALGGGAWSHSLGPQDAPPVPALCGGTRP